ncbi:MAG TPA: hypothetical protein VGN40_05975, partial [Lelliottia sp.]
LRGSLSLFLAAFGSGAILHPCRSHPLGASLRLDPASRKRFGDFQPDSRSLQLYSRLNVAPVLAPLSRSQDMKQLYSAEHKVNGTTSSV